MSTRKFLLKNLNTAEKLIWLLTLFLFSSFLIFETYTWGKYVVLSVTALIAILSVLSNKMTFRYMLKAYHYHLLAMIVYVFMTAAWGMSPSDAIGKGITLLEIFICMFVLYNHFAMTIEPVYQLLSIIKWGSYVISIYSLYFYGTKFISEMVQSGIRIENEYTNINSIGMLAALGIIIQIDQIFTSRKLSLATVFCVPSFYMLMATQSRKAFVMLIIGVVLSAILRNTDSQNGFKTFVRIIAIVVAAYIVISQVLKLPIFEAYLKRMEKMIASFTGEGQSDRSSTLRRTMIEIGMKQFRANPFFGNGFGSSHLVLKQAIGVDSYMHNNYIEILSCGGIVGLIIYYSAYFNITFNYLKYARYGDEYFKICFILLLILLIIDYGSVSLFSKKTYFYMMTLFLEVEVIKNNSRRLQLRYGS
jgi:O-antigen ligase